MNTQEFDAVARSKISSKPGWFSSVEKPLDKIEIEQELRKLKFNVPDDYLYFVENYGAGYFGSINISSLNSDSEWYRWNRPLKIQNNKTMFVVSDDETGGYYGFLANDGQWIPGIYYAHVSDHYRIQKISDSFLNFVAGHAFNF